MKKWFRLRSIKVPLIYCAFSILWIFVTDRINALVSSDIAKATTIAMIKGTFFVLVSTLLIHLLLVTDSRQEAKLHSELQKVQNSFTSLFANNPQPIWLFDPESDKFLAVNHAACELYKCSQEQFLNMTLADVCDPTEYERLHSDMGLDTFYMNLSGPWHQMNRVGEKIAVNLFPLRIMFAGRSAAMVTVFDLSRQLDLEAELKTAAIQRDDYEAFSYSVSHDLRTPLRTISGYSRVLMSDYAPQMDERMRGYLTSMDQASQEMNQMIDNMLMLTRLKRSSLNLDFVDLSKIAGEILKQLADQEPDRRVEFKILPEALVKADASLMKNLLYNLFENAWKYTARRDPARIEFGVRKDVEKGRVYYVKDNGLGFTPEEAVGLFKPFTRTHAVGEYPGMGIGLSIAARIIERHKGEIWAEGEKDEGAAFCFTLGME